MMKAILFLCVVLFGELIASNSSLATNLVINRDITASILAPSHVNFNQEFEVRPTIRNSGAAVNNVRFRISAWCRQRIPNNSGERTVSCFSTIVSASGANCSQWADGRLDCLVNLPTNSTVSPRIRLRSVAWLGLTFPDRAARVDLCADTGGNVRETNETNNCTSRYFEISRPANLSIGFQNSQGFSYQKNQNKVLVVTVRNRGSFLINNAEIKINVPFFYIGGVTVKENSRTIHSYNCSWSATGGTVTCVGSLDGTDVDENSELGPAVDIHVTLRPKSSVPNGTYVISATVDPNNRIAEASERDNVATQSVNIWG